MKELYRYHKLETMIERKKLGLSLWSTSNWSDEPRSSNNEPSSKVEQRILQEEEIKNLEDELHWYELFRKELHETELAIWDTRFYQNSNLTNTVAADLIGISERTYYKYYNMLQRKMRKEHFSNVQV